MSVVAEKQLQTHSGVEVGGMVNVKAGRKAYQGKVEGIGKYMYTLNTLKMGHSFIHRHKRGYGKAI